MGLQYQTKQLYIADTILANKRPGNGIGQSILTFIDADGNTV
jgi:hypothetical protein